MRRTLLFLSLFAIAGTAVAEAPRQLGEPAWTAPLDPAELALATLPLVKAGVALQRWQPVDAAVVEAVRTANANAAGKRLQIGIERGLAERDAKAADWSWSVLPDGRPVARLRVQSPAAEGLRVALDLRGLPEGAELRFAADGESASVVAPVLAREIAAQRAVAPLYWGPVTDGDTQLIELRLPKGADTRFLQLDVSAVSHLLWSPYQAWDGSKIGESGSCNVDVRCETSPPAAYTNAKNSVARMVFQEGGSYLCTGTLLNDTESSTQVPYFYTAAHCFTSQSTANTLTTFWGYEATACRSNQLDSASRQVTGGATVLFASESADALFLRLNNAPPAGSYFLGWDAAQVSANTNVLVVHHPRGDVKKRTLGRITGIGNSTLASGSFIKAGYTSGTTEGGSSGCALMTFTGSEYVLRGGLLGGGASCSNASNTPGMGGNSDDFSRFDQVFPNIRNYLFTSTNQGPPAGTDFTGAWSNPSQNGWGLVVVRGASGGYAMYVYHYDQDNTPAWYLSSGTLSNNSYTADLFAFRGPWFGTNPFNPAQVSSRDAGGITVNFTAANSANVSFTIDGRTVQTTLTKLAF